MRELNILELSVVSGGGLIDSLFGQNTYITNSFRDIGNILVGTSNAINGTQNAILGPVGSVLNGLSGGLVHLVHRTLDYSIYQATNILLVAPGQFLGASLQPDTHYGDEWITFTQG